MSSRSEKAVDITSKEIKQLQKFYDNFKKLLTD